MTDVITQAEPVAEPQQPVYARAVIIGTGFSGLGMAIKLQQQGVDFVILEKFGDVGGTWRDNSYPGCACDIPSHLYSFSFEPNPGWKNPFSYQPEIWDYLKGVTAKYGLRRHITFGAHVDRAHWDDEEHRWHVFTKDGREFVGQFLISGAGALHIPSIPDIVGRDEFAGAAFHSAEWDHSVDLTGKRVAMIGTGASAIQIVPEIVNRVAELQLYQRTPPWVVPRSNPEIPPAVRRAMATVPGLRPLVRLAIYWGQEALAFGMTKRPNMLKFIEAYCKFNIRRSVKDRELRRKLVPNYRIGCKRILNSSKYYRAVADPKTELVTDHIARITRDGIVTVDGTERPVDVIVFGTGFHVTDSYTYVGIKGRNGEDLVDRWNREGIAAHRGIAVAEMPNLFFLLGPNTGLGHNSVVFMIESQIRYVADAIKTCDKLGVQALAPTRAAQDRFNEELQTRLGPSVWNSGGCASWYLDEHGKNTVLWGGYTWEYWRDTRRIRPAEFEFYGAGAPARRPAS
ncbi:MULTISPECIES: NAD(P)/FAD-dependent oxidoreductase [unclassified Mycobacterium]|uniref:flavin-containing monooxygenase n=1 Tax=unclassified Mycobacterium TaxID=2642494 RepID=UPI0007FBBBE5|nr:MULTISPECIES: NAD(P)/FAD-dependent oxidoreductase [unclassified Mycobacterium]OBG78470.1 4-hydroxyacetophenone monooxygenase [Mycobacterium sp. E1214]OBH27824.1 4-hydroxyacetophenone monooxygenase [Mycobacterium sp. E1319]